METVARNEEWDVKLTNLSDMMGCLSVVGPKSQDILSKLNKRFENKFPFCTYDQVNLFNNCLNAQLSITV